MSTGQCPVLMEDRTWRPRKTATALPSERNATFRPLKKPVLFLKSGLTGREKRPAGVFGSAASPAIVAGPAEAKANTNAAADALNI